MRGKVLVLHCEFYNSYWNKNLGYFIQHCLSKGFQVDFLTLSRHTEEYDGKFGEGFRLIALDYPSVDSRPMLGYLAKHAREYEYAWLYPLYRRLLRIFAIFRMNGVKPILKLDNIRLVRGDEPALKKLAKIVRVNLLYLLSFRMIFETDILKSGFLGNGKFRKFTVGLSDSNIHAIKRLSGSTPREKVIVYPGRIIHAKGLDRLVDAFVQLKTAQQIPPDWRLHVVGKAVEADFTRQVMDKVAKAGMQSDILFADEKSGDEYYREIVRSSLVVLPSRSEGLPNILADAYFSRRLFLTTNVAKCREFITDPLFFCGDDTEAIRDSIERIIADLDGHYARFDRIYPKEKFTEADPFFAELVGG